MDPLIDEKFVLTISQILPEYFFKNLKINAIREAFGPSINEGLCYESCMSVDFSGEINGTLYIATDGYTKLKLLPRIAKSFLIDPTMKAGSDSILSEFANQIAASLVGEMKHGRYSIEVYPPENKSHKLIPIDLEKNRQYILIYFLKSDDHKEYVGRVYIVLTIKKFVRETDQSLDTQRN